MWLAAFLPVLAWSGEIAQVMGRGKGGGELRRALVPQDRAERGTGGRELPENLVARAIHKT